VISSQRAWSADDARQHVDACLRQGVRAVYQPIVDLETRQVVGLEALARPPAGSAFESPGPMFVAAKRAGLLAAADLACRKAAVEGALAADLPPGIRLFVNVEPEVMAATPPADVPALFALPDGLTARPVLEITERAFSERPDRLLAALRAARAAGWSIAVDDVGANPDFLALLSFVRPDVVRVDGSLVHNQPGRKAGYVAGAIRAYVERTGAVVLGECIENEDHVDHALAFGATLGQGWLFGRPGPVPALEAPSNPLRDLSMPESGALGTPFEIVRAAGLPIRAASRVVIASIARGIEAEARADNSRPVVLAAVQHASGLMPDAARRLGELAHHSAFVAAFGVGMPEAPASRVVGVAIAAEDPLAGEWAVAVVGPRHATALVARDFGRESGDAARYEYAVTESTAVTHAVAETLMRRCVLPT
jgi:EAL domain-containing protein (putative c-di-GMP-specific phosphodiesterase class I)